MKITLFADMKAEGWRSMDRYADALLRELSIINSQLSIFSTEPPVKFSRVKTFWRNKVYPRLARLHQSDVNHILDHSYAHLLKYLDPSKTVITCHDLTPLDFEKDRKIRESFRKVVANLVSATVIITDSQETKRDIIKHLSIPAEKIEVIYLGVDPVFRPREYREEKSRIRRKFNLPEGKIIFGHGQAHLPYKNTEGVIAAFAQIAKERSDVYFLRVNALTVKQIELLEISGLKSRYFEIKNPTDEDLVDLYNVSDVFLSPSFKEGFGLPVLQALACGVPVVVSPGGSLEEIADECGVYADPRDTQDIVRGLNLVLNDGFDPITFRKKAVERAQIFSWTTTAQKTHEVYENIFRQTKI